MFSLPSRRPAVLSGQRQAWSLRHGSASIITFGAEELYAPHDSPREHDEPHHSHDPYPTNPVNHAAAHLGRACGLWFAGSDVVRKP